jgi:glycine cleavage system regulatory protein
MASARVPVGASPQLLISAIAAHKPGASKDIAELVFEQGASIASTKKIMVEDHFGMMLSIWTPPDGMLTPSELCDYINSDATRERLGFIIQAKLLDSARQRVLEPTMAATQQRRMKLELPQRPGIVLAITELLKDQGCTLSSIDADVRRHR